MKTVLTITLCAFCPLALGSTPIVEGDAIACVSGDPSSRSAAQHTVSFNDGDELPIRLTGSLVSLIRLKASTTYSAVFRAGESEVQTIDFSFKDYPADRVCFSYDTSSKHWSVGSTPADMCESCSDTSDGT